MKNFSKLVLISSLVMSLSTGEATADQMTDSVQGLFGHADDRARAEALRAFINDRNRMPAPFPAGVNGPASPILPAPSSPVLSSKRNDRDRGSPTSLVPIETPAGY